MGPQLEFIGETGVRHNGRVYTFFGGNDYHRFSSNPDLLSALSEAAHEHGFNTAGSRFTTANHTLYLQLEEAVAGYLGAEAALICSAGYLSSIVLLQGIGEQFDALFIDETAHGSLLDGALQTGKRIIKFRHSDADHLADQLKTGLTAGQRPFVVTDGVFASIGDMPPLAAYAELMQRYGGRIVVDDAHAVAVIGQTGKGSWEELGVPLSIVYQTGTLSKGLGGFGGFVTGTSDAIARIRERSRAFKGSTPMPLPVAAASIKAIEILQAHPEKLIRLRSLTDRVKPRLRDLGFAIASGAAPICSVTCMDIEKNWGLGERLERAGIFPSFIDYPGSPPGGHYRFTLSSAHSDDEIETLLDAVRE